MPEPTEFVLDNGMRFLVLDRPGAPLTSAVWVVRIGSSDDPEQATGTAHLLEHLLFRGSTTIGRRTRTGSAARERHLLEREETLVLKQRQARRPGDTSELETVQAELREFEVKGDFARIYTEAGAVGLNAVTRKDLSAFWVSVPSSKLELWFWLESDRMRDPVLRGFYQELPIIAQERRQRIDAVPGGPELEQFNEAFWGEHPYAWPAIGRSADLERLERSSSEAFFSRSMVPERVTAVLIGDLDPAQIKSWAETYFGDWSVPESGESGSPAREGPAADAESARHSIAFDRSCACPIRIELRFPTVPFSHPDALKLDLLAAVLAGRSGRLNRELVLSESAAEGDGDSKQAGAAFSAIATHTPLRLAGTFSLEVEGRDDADSEDLERRLRELIGTVREQGFTAREVERGRNQLMTSSARQVKAPLSLALRLGVYDVLGDWRRVFDLPSAVQAITKEQLEETVRTYLEPEAASVFRLQRAEGERP